MINVKYACYVNKTGYSQSAIDTIFMMRDTGLYNIQIVPIGAVELSAFDEQDRRSISSMISNDVRKDFVSISQCMPSIQAVHRRGKKNIGFSVYETVNPPLDIGMKWRNSLSKNDVNIAPSMFCYREFMSLENVRYIPHVIDINIYNGGIKKKIAYDRFSFLFMGTWRQRKGYEVLIESWMSEFDNRDNVQLVIKTDRKDVAEKYIERFKKDSVYKNKNTAPIVVNSSTMTRSEVASFVASHHCMVSPSMGEGFGIPCMQALSIGIPIITSNLTGQSEYANDETAILLKNNGWIYHNEVDVYPQFKNNKWIYITSDDLSNKMRYVVNNYAESRKKAQVGKRLVHEKFVFSVVQNAFNNMISDAL